eukprot:CAMPEP_0197040426 /NCGR_PEP_ID=MMETSP1384-20130603/17117_1 /TAXON_ID=29189 /ORGANISM="Ammonia sp." /LENGTH=487 /DNA_ID=CAMNT_0042471175 /DNA_START=21 /DNA_END=1484 /DNA_ORIENTATION=-
MAESTTTEEDSQELVTENNETNHNDNDNDNSNESNIAIKPELKPLISALKKCDNASKPAIKRSVTFVSGLISGKSDVKEVTSDKEENEEEEETAAQTETFDDDENLVLNKTNEIDSLNFTNWAFGGGSFSGSETSDDEKDFAKDMDRYRHWSRQHERAEERKEKMKEILMTSTRRLRHTKQNIAKLKQEILEEQPSDHDEPDQAATDEADEADKNDNNNSNSNSNKTGNTRKRRREQEIEDSYKEWKKKQNKKGVIYITSVPFGCTSKQLKKIFAEFGVVTNVHLEAAKKENGEKKKIHNRWTEFCEAWVEFKDKKIAKQVVELLNDTKIPKKYVKNRLAKSHIWNMKYLKGFGWHHLNEYKQTVQTLQRKKYEIKIAEAHRQASYFEAQVNKAKEMTRGFSMNRRGRDDNHNHNRKQEEEEEEEEDELNGDVNEEEDKQEEEDAVFESSEDEAPPVKKRKVIQQRGVRMRRNHRDRSREILSKMMK